MNNGFIKLYREITDNSIWQHKPYARGQAFIDLILKANYKTHEIYMNNQPLIAKRGEVITSELKLMRQWGWSKSKVRRYLKYLQEKKMIEIKTDAKKTTLTICNYDKYQNIKTSKEPLKDCQKTTERPLKDTNNKEKKEKKEQERKEYKNKESLKKLSPLIENSKEAKKFATWFENLLPDNIIISDTDKAKWAKIFDDLIRLDGKTKAEIIEACQWARDDDFWTSNFLSPLKLRRKNKDGIKYIDVFLQNLKISRQRATNG